MAATVVATVVIVVAMEVTVVVTAVEIAVVVVVTMTTAAGAVDREATSSTATSATEEAAVAGVTRVALTAGGHQTHVSLSCLGSVSVYTVSATSGKATASRAGDTGIYPCFPQLNHTSD